MGDGGFATPFVPVTEPVPHLASAARRMETPCGEGQLVWRSWGAGPVLVLLHGGTGSWRHWAGNIAALSRTRRVLAPDLPGLGDSALPPMPATPGSIGAIVADGLAGLLPADMRYDIAGFSYGALISSQVAALHGARVRSLTVVGPSSLGLPRTGIVLEKVRSKTGAERTAANRVNLGRFMIADATQIDARALAIQDWNTVHARFKSKGFAESTALRDAVARAPAKLNAIWGSCDVTAAPDLATRAAALRGARPDVDFRVIEGAGHWVAYEAADAFNAMLADMLGAG
ncbi:alpha/beta fold hydrolase [Limobrevibacterium gyesilva]|uniref:Alpha/beta fold hydrolase n=1 Tax=Limobrevibacterium gyesilva TaxID=2991712 RepID=A0AA41YLP1_9PROT|nr:alpha/beta fold hydrolase [Limobrevibacterium gyesilva]MCW3474238.1 alpha/beta fold hydrolase [Limobrevibacterium gyesilva]